MATITRLTYADLEAIPQEGEGDQHELIDGELIVTPSPFPDHQEVSSNIAHALERVVRENNLGRVYAAPTDIRLTPDNVLIPDIFFVARERLHIVGPRTIDAAPDLVVEILAPGTRRRDLTVKRNLYAQFGVREYWVVDPDDRTVIVFERVGRMYQPAPPLADGAIQSRVLPALKLTLEAVFEGV